LRQAKQEELDSIVEALMLVEDENFLRQEILVPALSAKFGRSHVQDVHGPRERGIDIVCSDVSQVPGRTELIGVVVKAGQVGVHEAREAVEQARQALGGSYEIPGQSPDRDRCRRVWVVAVGHWTNDAQDLWKEQEGQHDFRPVERLTSDEVAQLVRDKSVQDKLLQKVGLWAPAFTRPVEPPDLRSILSLLSSQTRSAALHAATLGVTHWSTNDPPRAMQAMRRALHSGQVPFFGKRALLGWLARYPSTNSDVQSLVREVLTEAVLGRHFLAQLDGPEWLKVMGSVFEQLAQHGPTEVQRTLGHTIARVCRDEHDLAASFLRLLWPTQDQGVGLGCIRIIEELSLWEEIENLLEQAAEQWSPILRFMPFAILSAVRRGELSDEFAVKWLAKWTLSEIRGRPIRDAHFRDSLRHAFGDLVEQHPASVLPYAVELVEANCEAGKQSGDERYGLKDTDLRVRMRFRIGLRGSREEPALIVLTALMQLAEKKRCPMHVRDIVDKLLESDYTAARAMAIRVCRAKPEKFIRQCAAALTDWRHLVYPLGDVTRPLLTAAYHLIPTRKQEKINNVLLSLEAGTETQECKDISRLYALKSIPGEHRSKEVSDEILRLEGDLGKQEVPPEPEMHVYLAPASDSQVAKQIHDASVEEVIDSLRKLKTGEPHRSERYDASDAVKTRAERDRQFALELAVKLATTPSVPSNYAKDLLWATRDAHTTEDRMEVLWTLRGLDDSGVHGIAADIIENSAPDLSDDWVRRARLLLYRWATDPDPAATGEADADLLMTGINSARGRVVEALLRLVGEHGLTEKSREVLRALAEDGSPAVRACVLAKLGHLRRDHYYFSLDLFKQVTECEDNHVLQYTIWYARYIESKDYQRYVEPVIRRAVQSDDNEVARVGGFLAAWGLLEPQRVSSDIGELLVNAQQSAVLLGAAEVFSANVYSQNEEIAKTSRDWCLRLMESGRPDIAGSVVRGLWHQDSVDLRSVLNILLLAAESDDIDTIRALLSVLEKSVKDSPNEAANVLSKLWSRETSREVLMELHIEESQHEVLEELLQNDDVTVRNRQRAWEIFDALLKAGDIWAVGKFNEYVEGAAVE